MNTDILQKLEAINASLARLLEEVHRCLGGERAFSVAMVREMASLVEQMAPVLPKSKALRTAHPELAAPLDRYLLLASELRGDLEKIRVMLVNQRAVLETSRTHLEAVSKWTSALSTTR